MRSLQIKIFVTYSNNFVSRKFDAATENKILVSKRFESVSRKFVSITENKVFLNKFLIVCTVRDVNHNYELKMITSSLLLFYL